MCPCPVRTPMVACGRWVKFLDLARPPSLSARALPRKRRRGEGHCRCGDFVLTFQEYGTCSRLELGIPPWRKTRGALHQGGAHLRARAVARRAQTVALLHPNGPEWSGARQATACPRAANAQWASGGGRLRPTYWKVWAVWALRGRPKL